MTMPRRSLTIALGTVIAPLLTSARQPSFDVVPVGVRYDPIPIRSAGRPISRPSSALRFTVVARPRPLSPGA